MANGIKGNLEEDNGLTTSSSKWDNYLQLKKMAMDRNCRSRHLATIKNFTVCHNRCNISV